MKKLKILLIIAILLLIPLVTFAHKGHTDSNGGHYDSTTGEYHYHHGYEAHQHPNGVCPYEYDDKTQYSNGTITSNTTSTIKENTNNINSNVSNFSTNNTINTDSTQYDKYFKIGGWLLLSACILIPICIIANLPETVKKTKEK